MPSHTMTQLRTKPPSLIFFEARPVTMSMLPVNSSAPQHSTSTRPKLKQMPPTMRWAANGTAESPRNTRKYVAPNAMNAPASIASTKHFAPAIPALPTASVSAFASISAGPSASDRSAFTSD